MASSQPCPDPSVHPSNAPDGSANKAAALATHPGARHSTSSSREIEALGPDGRLSAAGAATSLKYANARDLPSYPSVGIDTNSGNKAATLASSNPKSVDLWKPDASSSAGKAALLASRDGGKLDLWEPKASGTGGTAATAALAKNTSPQLDFGYTKEGHRRALLAATKSLNSQDRPASAASSITTGQYPDQANAAYNALNAATVAGRPGSRISTTSDAARFSMPREMYTERPPVALEVDEKKHQEALRASAISMAKDLYSLERSDVERSITNPGSVAADRVASQSYNAATTNLEGDMLRVQAMNYTKVQEAAQKLAAERLAKMDPDGVRAYREHYGYGPTQRSKLSLRVGKKSGERQTEEADSSDDEMQAAKVKSQMSRLNDQVASVDAKKRTDDRKNVLAAAERIVQARLHTMDEKVFNETGKVPPQLMEEWEAKARVKAAADSETRMENHGKVHIGGGKFMDQSEVDAIASARMQPTLDEITDEAERRRAHEETVRLDQERHKEQQEAEKQRERETKLELKRVQDEEKEAERKLRAEEKAKEREEKEKAREELELEKLHRDAERRLAKAEEKQAKEQAKEARKRDKAFVAEQEKLDQERQRMANLEAAEQRAAEIQEKKEIQKREKEALAVIEQDEKDQQEEKLQESETTKPVVVVEKTEENAATPRDIDTGAEATDITTAETVTTDNKTTDIVTTGTTEAVTAGNTATSPTATSPTKRDSRVKSFLSKLKRPSKGPSSSEGGETTTVTNTTATMTSAAGGSADLSDKAKGKQPAEVSPISSTQEEPATVHEEEPTAGRESSVEGDVFEEARDTIVAEPEPTRTSVAHESTTASKFQEEL